MIRAIYVDFDGCLSEEKPAHQMNIPTQEIVGIGDSGGDWQFMKKCGFTACPSGAADMLKKEVDYVAGRPTSRGTKEIIQYVLDNLV